ncbi:MAG: D-2-hydroxyacid dehydrogenase [Woeseiaceae bacterium]
MNSRRPTAIYIHGSNLDYWTSLITKNCSDVDIVSKQQLDESATDGVSVDALIGWRFPPELFTKLPKLRWIQFISVSIDEFAVSPQISPDVMVTNTKGLYSDSVADYVLWALLTLTRKFNVVTRNQSRRRWHQISGPTMRGKTIGIYGVGSVGRAVAQRARAFEMRTVGIVSDQSEARQLSSVDETIPQRDLHQAIGDFDAFVICVPLTEATKGVVNADLITKMKPSAYIINTVRGGVADEAAIAAALENGSLAGAAIDSFDKEPVRRWSPLWKTRNLLITPHISGITDDYQQRVGDLICENIRRFSAGDGLLGLVDRVKGY